MSRYDVVDKIYGRKISEYIGLKCPMCEQGTLIHETINGVEYYSCSECPMVAIEDYDYNLRDKLEEDTK